MPSIMQMDSHTKSNNTKFCSFCYNATIYYISLKQPHLISQKKNTSGLLRKLLPPTSNVKRTPPPLPLSLHPPHQSLQLLSCIVHLPPILLVLSSEGVGKDILPVARGEGYDLESVVHPSSAVSLLLVGKSQRTHILQVGRNVFSKDCS